MHISKISGSRSDYIDNRSGAMQSVVVVPGAVRVVLIISRVALTAKHVRIPTETIN